MAYCTPSERTKVRGNDTSYTIDRGGGLESFFADRENSIS